MKCKNFERRQNLGNDFYQTRNAALTGILAGLIDTDQYGQFQQPDMSVHTTIVELANEIAYAMREMDKTLKYV